MMHDYDMKSLTGTNNKVDKVTGKALSSNDFNSTYKTQLDNFINNGMVGGVIATSSDSTNYAATFNNVTTYNHGILVAVLNNKNSVNNAGATLNINGLGAKPIYYKNRIIQAGEFAYRSVSLFLYVTWTAFNNGEGAWILIDDRDTTYPDASTSTKGLMTTNHVTLLNNLAGELENLEDHVHGQIKNNGAIGTTSGLFVVTGNNGVLTTSNQIGNLKNNGAIGTTSGGVVITGSNGVLTTTTPVTLSATFTDGSTSNYKVLPGS